MRYDGFKKVFEDDNSAVMKHKNGSELKIAKKGLKADHRKALEKLPVYAAEGYPKPQNASFDDFVPGKDYKDEPLPGDQNASFMPQQHNFMDQEAMHSSPIQGFMTPGMGRVNQINDLLQDQNAYPQGSEARTKLEEELKKYPEATDYIARQTPGNSPQPDSSQSPLPQNVLASNNQGTAQDIAPTDSPTPPEQPARDPLAEMKDSGTGEISPNQDTTPPNFQEYVNKAQKHYWNQDQLIKDDLNRGIIKPETYQSLFAKKDTLGKLGTLFSLFVGGIASGIAGKTPIILDMMKQEIQNDMDAQGKNVTNAQNMLRVNQDYQKMLNEGKLTGAQANALKARSALDFQTYNYMLKNRAALDSFAKVSQGLPDGPKKDAALKGLALLHNVIDNEHYSFAGRMAVANAMLKFGSQGTGVEQAMAYQGHPEMANYNQAHRLAGTTGLTDKPVPGDIQQQMIAKQELHQKLNTLEEWVKTHNRPIDKLNPREVTEGRALAKNVYDTLRMSRGHGVPRPGEKAFADGMIDPDPSKWFSNIRTMPKYEMTRQNNIQEMQNFARAFKVQLSPEFSGSQSGSNEEERMIPDSKKVGIFDSKTKTFLRWKNK